MRKTQSRRIREGKIIVRIPFRFQSSLPAFWFNMPFSRTHFRFADARPRLLWSRHVLVVFPLFRGLCLPSHNCVNDTLMYPHVSQFICSSFSFLSPCSTFSIQYGRRFSHVLLWCLFLFFDSPHFLPGRVFSSPDTRLERDERKRWCLVAGRFVAQNGKSCLPLLFAIRHKCDLLSSL